MEDLGRSQRQSSSASRINSSQAKTSLSTYASAKLLLSAVALVLTLCRFKKLDWT
jgi:hypothetical protein